MFIETEETPNPLAIKFYPNHEILKKGSIEFTRDSNHEISPLAKAIFSIENIEKIFLSKDFITITKSEKADWEELKPQILALIMEHFSNKNTVINASFYSNDNIEKTNNEIENKIITILDACIRPVVAKDGGDVEFNKYEEGIVYVYLRGACAGCPGAQITLKKRVEKILREYIPEIISVEAINFNDRYKNDYESLKD